MRTSAADKLAQFGPGPWIDEIDRVTWHAGGLYCLIERALIGTFCGYVRIPEGHPWHGMDPSDLDDRVSVHGGITYAASFDGGWLVGFDCAHAGDAIPQVMHIVQRGPGPDEIYRDR